MTKRRVGLQLAEHINLEVKETNLGTGLTSRTRLMTGRAKVRARKEKEKVRKEKAKKVDEKEKERKVKVKVTSSPKTLCTEKVVTSVMKATTRTKKITTTTGIHGLKVKTRTAFLSAPWPSANFGI